MRHSQALRVANDDVGTGFAGRRAHGAGEQVGANRDEHAALVGARHDRREVGDCAMVIGRLDVEPERLGRERG